MSVAGIKVPADATDEAKRSLADTARGIWDDAVRATRRHLRKLHAEATEREAVKVQRAAAGQTAVIRESAKQTRAARLAAEAADLIAALESLAQEAADL